jgi:hypothetical protein
MLLACFPKRWPLLHVHWTAQRLLRLHPQAPARVATSGLQTRGPCVGAPPIAPPLKVRARVRPKEGPGRVVHAKKGGPQ